MQGGRGQAVQPAEQRRNAEAETHSFLPDEGRNGCLPRHGRQPEHWSAEEIEQQRIRFCAVWQVIEEAELVDEYEAWKEANPNA